MICISNWGFIKQGLKQSWGSAGALVWARTWVSQCCSNLSSPKNCCRSCWILVVESQCQPGSTQHRFPRSSSGVTLSCGKSCENYMYKPGCVSFKHCGTSIGTLWGLKWNLKSWNIITASLKLEKTPRTIESDLQNHWVQLLKLHRTFTGISQHFHREFPQTFWAFSTTAKAGISPQWAPTQHHKHKILWSFLPM